VSKGILSADNIADRFHENGFCAVRNVTRRPRPSSPFPRIRPAIRQPLRRAGHSEVLRPSDPEHSRNVAYFPCTVRSRSHSDGSECQKRSSPVCMVMNKLTSHPPVFILTPSRRSTPICIYYPDLIPSSYIIDYMTYYCFRMPVFLLGYAPGCF
jgi:hypothetical protein